jgi:hypothetical protein
MLKLLCIIRDSGEQDSIALILFFNKRSIFLVLITSPKYNPPKFIEGGNI